MLISVQNILGGQLSAIGGKHLEIELPLSKSESNRALMILHYAKSQSLRDAETQSVMSDSDDTLLLQKHLDTLDKYLQSPLSVDGCPLTLDCHNAGTVFRFLMTAVANLQFTIDDKQSFENLNNLATQQLSILLTGSERMKSRPISSLVDALRNLGVAIEYTEKEGFPPILLTVDAVVNRQQTTDNRQQTLSTTLHPTPSTLNSTLSTLNSLEISAEQSSQFASSLLLAAPLWKDGLELHLTGNLSSLPYIDMTINMMRQCGVDVVRNDRDITVKPGRYNIEDIKVEPDWSAAAFWYEMVSLSDDAEVLLKNLNINSLQADATAIKMFESLGVETTAVEDGVVVRKVNSQRSIVRVQSQSSESEFRVNSQSSTFNFKDCPDLFPSVIAACAGNRVNATFTGLKNLSIKESDRKRAMMNELSKINIAFEDVSDDELKMFCPDELPYFTEENPIIFNNYEDHRIAMALSILSMKIGAISMENIDVVAKSYPGFFKTR